MITLLLKLLKNAKVKWVLKHCVVSSRDLSGFVSGRLNFIEKVVANCKMRSDVVILPTDFREICCIELNSKHIKSI